MVNNTKLLIILVLAVSNLLLIIPYFTGFFSDDVSFAPPQFERADRFAVADKPSILPGECIPVSVCQDLDTVSIRTAQCVKQNIDCAAGEICSNGACVPGTCTPDGECNTIVDSVKIEKNDDRLNLGDAFNDVFPLVVNENTMPNTLAQGTYLNTEGSRFNYEQRVDFGSQELTYFRDSDYESIIGTDENTPVIGVKMMPGDLVLRYALEFYDRPNSTNVSGNLISFENTHIEIMGELFRIDSFEISPFVKIRMTRLSDNSVFELSDGEIVEVNQEDADGLRAFIETYHSAGVSYLDMIRIEWRADEELFIAPGSSPVMPGFGTLQFIDGGFYTEREETTTIQPDGPYGLELNTVIRDGPVTINLLYSNGAGTFDGIGRNTNARLATSRGTSVEFIEKDSNGNDYHDYFVATHVPPTFVGTFGGESYLLRAEVQYSDTLEQNYVNVLKWDGDAGSWEYVCLDKVDGDVCDIGSVSLRIADIIWGPFINERSVSFERVSNVVFDTLFTESGLGIALPVQCDVSGGGDCAEGDIILGSSYYSLPFVEERDENPQQGSLFSLDIGFNSDGEIQVTGVQGSGTEFEIASTDSYESYVYSDYATKLVRHTSVAQAYAEVTYHGEEAYGQIYLNGPEMCV